jgi:RNA polymerase sigma factor (TIGR02999 family)
MSETPITRDYELTGEVRLEDVYPQVYGELRRLAQYYMKQERDNHTLQATALVHEAYLRMSLQNPEFANRNQFVAVASSMMRRILVNHAVRRNRQKREGNFVQITLDRAMDEFAGTELNLIDLDRALRNLTRIDPRQARLFELRFFGGLTIEESAEVLEISPATVKREWVTAKLFLRRELFAQS